MTLGVQKHQGEFDFGPEFLDGDQLVLRGRLRVLQDDPRAGFLPTTHEEKNQALTMLDYIDNPEHPAGIANQLQEVFIHQKNLSIEKAKGSFEEMTGDALWQAKKKASQKGEIEGRRAVISITNEFGDYLKDAIKQTGLLSDLAAKIADCPNPAVTIADEVGVEDPGIAALLRYKDLVAVRDDGKLVDLPLDPLNTRENRSKQKDSTKNKTLHDVYTASELDPLIEERIKEFAHLTTIKDVRGLIKQALEDQERRKSFWTSRVQEAQVHGAARIAAEPILKSLGIALR